MRRKRCTDKNAHNIHITMPNRVIPAATTANPSIGSIDIMAGSFCEYFQQLRTNKYPNQQSINFAIKNQVANLIKTTKQSLELSTIA